jgi:metal-responsive CopG/Arc/MetJ family transcriptional regulator
MHMKTAISLPDDTFDRASRRAAELGMSRSQFFATAAQRYLDDLDAETTTRQIDLALETLAHPDDSSDDAVDAGRRTLDESDDEW